MELKNAYKSVSKGLLFNRRALFTLLHILLYFCSAAVFAAIPPAGEPVSSISYAKYISGEDSLTAVSNEVLFNILPIYGPVVLPNGSVADPAASDSAFSLETVTYSFSVFNSGNDEDEYELEVDRVSPSDFTFTSVTIYSDDGDGVIEPGEDAITTTGPIESGEAMYLIVEAGLPAGLTGGETAYLNLSARSISDTSAVDSDNVAQAVAKLESRLELSLYADRAEAVPGDTVEFWIDFTNTGDRAASDIYITDYINNNGILDNTVFVAGSASSSLPGSIEYLNAATSNWSGTAAPAEDVRGVRLLLAGLNAGETGRLSFLAAVDPDHVSGDIYNSSFADYTGGDLQDHHSVSNEVTVFIGRRSEVFIGPEGNPEAVDGSPDDIVTIRMNGTDSVYTFWHEIITRSNFTDTLGVCLADSFDLLPGWEVDFVDSNGVSLVRLSEFTAEVGPVASGAGVKVGLRYSSTPEEFVNFGGREREFDVEAFSLVDGGARNTVKDVFVKTDLPLISISQSIKEPVAEIGDVLSCILTVRNISEETTVDSITVVERLCAGMGYAGGSDSPAVEGNNLTWKIGALEPGQKKEIIFRVIVKAGQQRGNLLGNASAYGVTEFGEATAAGPAPASIRIVEGIFTRKGIVTGNVFLDGNGNGKLEKGERGVEGVSVFVENGTYCVTDSAGLYSIPGLDEGLHVLRIDPQTLPDSLAPGSGGHFGMGDGGEALVDLPPSGGRRMDFPLIADPGAGDEEYGLSEGEEGKAVPGFSDVLDIEANYSQADTASLADLPPEEGGAMGPPYTVMTFMGTSFEAGSAVLKEIPLEKAAKLALWMREHPRWEIFIEGHTDSVPINTEDFPSNLELSLERARSVFQLLRMNGIDEDRMDYTGSGSRKPLASNATAEGRARNRRVEVKALPPDDNAAPLSDLFGLIGEQVVSRSNLLSRDADVCSKVILPEEGHLFRERDRIEVRVVSELASQVELYVNNVPVGREKIGRKEIDTGNGTISNVFYDVKIKPGRNVLLIVTKRFGGEKSACIRHVYLSGNPAEIVPERKMISMPADGKTGGEIVFLVKDSNGLPVRDGIFVDVHGPEEVIEGMDVNPHVSGIQAATSGGKVTLRVPPSREVGRIRMSVSHKDISGGSFVSFESPLRNWFLFGYGETDVGVGNFKGSGSTARSAERYHDGLYAEGRIALYGQGQVADGHTLTMSLNTRPERYDKYLDRVEPEKHYPIYGDASQLKFNSSSRNGTYLRMDHKRYMAMFGDFKTDLSEMELARYDRTFIGLNGEARFRKGSFKGFITRTDQITYQEEFRADGTSGFYFLEHYPLIENSENIRIEVRDRYRPEKIIKVDYKQVNRDYDINYNDGSVLFKEPVASVDRGLNPVTIVVSYECSNSGEQNFIYGTRSTVSVTDSLKAGVTALLEEEGVENSSLVGFDVTGNIVPAVKIEGEFAHSEKFLLGGGNAFRISLSGRKEDILLWNVYYREIDDNFFNPSFSGGKTELGSRKFGLKLDWRIDRRFSVKVNQYRHKFMERDEEKGYMDLVGVYRRESMTTMAGIANVTHSDIEDGDRSAVMLLAGVSVEDEKNRGELRYDQKIGGEEVEEYPNRFEAKLSRKLWKHITGTLDHEYRTGSRSGTRHRTRIGAESQVTKDLNVYSRYNLEGAMSGERGQATIGLKNDFELSEGLTGTFKAEKLATVSGVGVDDFTSLAASCNYTPRNKDYRVKGDYEVKFETERIKHLVTFGGIKRLDDRWSGMAKGDVWISDEKEEPYRAKASSTIGTSFRPEAAQDLTLLSLVKARYEKNSPAHPGGIDKELLISSEANYAINSDWELGGKIAAKWVKNTFKLQTASASTFMYQGQIIKLFPGRWDLTLTGRLLYQRETGTWRYGTGVEAGKIVMDNLWIGAGYTFAGHADSEVFENEFSESGFHVGMKMKFSEKLLNYFYR